MKQVFILGALVCLIAMLLPACAAAPEPVVEAAPEPVFDQAAEEAAIRAWVEERIAAYNRHDVQAITAQVDETYENWQGTLKGPAAFEKNRTKWFERAKDVQGKILDEIGIVFITPEVAIYKGRHEIIDDVDSDGKPLPPQKYLTARVLVKRNGKWLYVAGFHRPIEESPTT